MKRQEEYELKPSMVKSTIASKGLEPVAFALLFDLLASCTGG